MPGFETVYAVLKLTNTQKCLSLNVSGFIIFISIGM